MHIDARVLIAGMAVLSAVPALAADRSCHELKLKFEGTVFVAKEPLYDTVIGDGGILDLERDEDEIQPGSACRVKDIECGKKKVEVTLKQVDGSREFNEVEITFRIDKYEREGPEGMGRFQKMWDLVLEPEAPQ